ncbi:MAG: Tad domain-containing protein [Selenomonas sp.]|uniref:Tad domain-containing protein n=1 Tax=Selenomonas sp. TaxID=2053611 RepID=UPI0025D68A18|nr:Tad domain-containing protein [Selenomonas sp.]MCR5757737.1 Tad domain-containing protein [Selenomonas sp.]
MKTSNKEKGAVLVFFALLLPVVLVLGGGALDFGSLYLKKNNLQNLADASALAGMHVLDSSTKLRLVNPEYDGDKITFTLDGTEYELEKAADNDAAALKAKTELKKNNGDQVTAGFKTVHYEGSNSVQAYLVELENDYKTSFLKMVGVDTFDVSARAVAVALPGVNIVEEVERLSFNLSVLVPNMYWESLAEWPGFTVTDKDGNTTSYNGKKFWQDVTSNQKLYANNYSSTYYTTSFQGNVDAGILHFTTEGYEQLLLGYKDSSVTDTDDPDHYLAEEIRGNSNAKRQGDLGRLIYTLNSSWISDKGLKGFYIDQPAKEGSATLNGQKIYGWFVRTLEVNFNEDTGAVSDDSLYVRIESEPLWVGGMKNLTQVVPRIININAEQNHPLIIAYDGPDSRRRAADTLWVDPADAALLAAPVENAVKTNKANMVMTSMHSSAPFIVNLNSDFRGIIYAPNSVVTLNGTGKIDGYILARRIDYGTGASAGRTKVKKEFLLTGMSAEAVDDVNKKNNYTIYEDTATLEVVYNTFRNYS